MKPRISITPKSMSTTSIEFNINDSRPIQKLRLSIIDTIIANHKRNLSKLKEDFIEDTDVKSIKKNKEDLSSSEFSDE